ncbi:TPA: restriction endonuclease subunit S [Escherichia coli]|nr:restriction endonuclease subunit S [Escherichia coli]
MSEMSYLEKLLDGVEVEWRNLGDTSLFEIANNGRKPVKASLRIAGETPYYGANNIQDYVDGYTHDGEYVLIAEDGSASLENYSIQYATGKFWANNHVHVVRGKERVHSRFLYHYLCIVNFLPFLTGGGRAKLTKGQLIEIPVPIPCPDNPEKSLAIQSEIVRILDKFTALTAELTAELSMRKKQYNHYRDLLLSFEEGEVEWKTLGEIAKIQRGASPRPIAQYMTDADDGIPWIKIGDTSPGSKYINGTAQKVTPDGAKKSRILNPGDFVISNSMSFGRPYILSITGAIHDGWASISDFSERLDSDYLYHYLSSQRVKNYWGSKINSGSVSNLNADIIKTLPLPLPDIQKQKWIATLLDKFDTLTSSISEGIPREIELRQKQYEYYRDLLFSFPKSEAASN